MLNLWTRRSALNACLTLFAAAVASGCVASGGIARDTGDDVLFDTSDATPSDAQQDPVVPTCQAHETLCSSTCVDLTESVSHCGACDRRCVIPHATAACEASDCVLVACDLGRSDDNGLIADGCEADGPGCTDGSSCTTSCGSAGSFLCATNECTPPAETCNLIDDDCDAICDSPACRHGIHRANGNGHYYTNVESSISENGYNLETRNYYALYSSNGPGLTPFQQCLKGDGRRFYTTSLSCEGQTVEGTIGYLSQVSTCGSRPLYRLYNGSNHFYTVSEAERDNAVNSLGYSFERIAGYVW